MIWMELVSCWARRVWRPMWRSFNKDCWPPVSRNAQSICKFEWATYPQSSNSVIVEGLCIYQCANLTLYLSVYFDDNYCSITALWNWKLKSNTIYVGIHYFHNTLWPLPLDYHKSKQRCNLFTVMTVEVLHEVSRLAWCTFQVRA